MVSKDLWAGVGSALAFLAGLITLAVNQVRIKLFINKITASFSSTVQITIPEYTANRFERNELFIAIEAYISDRCTDRARKLKAELGKDNKNLQVSIDEHEKVIDDFSGTPTFLSSTARAVLSPSRTANAASSPTMLV